MSSDVQELERDPLTERILGCAFRVMNVLGPGFLEKVYERALVLELEASGLRVESQRGFTVRYRDEIVGEYVPDLLVEDEVIVELKCVKSLDSSHVAVGLNYLKVSGRRCCLLLNFQSPRLEVRRLRL